MKLFTLIDDLIEGKLYTIVTFEGQKTVVFREGDRIRSNAQIQGIPIRFFNKEEIKEFDEVLHS